MSAPPVVRIDIRRAVRSIRAGHDVLEVIQSEAFEVFLWHLAAKEVIPRYGGLFVATAVLCLGVVIIFVAVVSRPYWRPARRKASD